MSRIRDAVMSAADGNIVALGELIGDAALAGYDARRRWDTVRRFIIKRDKTAEVDDDDVDYGIVLERALKAYKIPVRGFENDEQAEWRLVKALLKKVEASPRYNREEIQRALASTTEKHDGTVLAAAFAGGGLLGLLDLGGFGTYIAMSSALSVASGAIGITLPFATYMGASSLLSVLIGPAGWLALAIGALSTLIWRRATRGSLELAALCVWTCFAMPVTKSSARRPLVVPVWAYLVAGLAVIWIVHIAFQTVGASK